MPPCLRLRSVHARWEKTESELVESNIRNRFILTGGSSDDGAVTLLKGSGGFGEGNDLSWADEGEVEWVKEENNVFAFVVAKIDRVNRGVSKTSEPEGNLFELAVDQSVGLEGRGGLADLSFSGGHVFL
jgi:hypothetical protein